MPEDEDFWAYFDPDAPNSAEQLETSMEELYWYIVEEGPFDGMMAFSQGCALAASFIMRHQVKGQFPHWRFSVFFCGEPGEVVDGKSMTVPTEEIITMPTLHCTGRKDKMNPERNALLSQQCRSETKSFYVYQGGHGVPSWRQEVIEFAHRMRRLW